ncbi:MAG: nicotinate-nucleotide adenylyltransferase [Lachnospiraceae bacterium]
MKIGIMGGTFDPIHNGHLMIGESAYENYDLEEIWFMPNGHPPHKEMRSIESSITQRVKMIQLAIAKTPYFKLYLHEVNPFETSYSYQTNKYLIDTFPEHTFYFILGADSLFDIETWVYPDKLLAISNILVANRTHKSIDKIQTYITYLNKKYDAHIELLDTPFVDISSHGIRDLRKQHLSFNHMVPREVEEYIYAQCLFEDKKNESANHQSN